jgi:hypothetical protein
MANGHENTRQTTAHDKERQIHMTNIDTRQTTNVTWHEQPQLTPRHGGQTLPSIT